jgi:predicted NUDIX family phosphoesterase
MEFVFVAPREAVFPSFYPQGLHAFSAESEAREFLARLSGHGFFVERERAERTPIWKQVIPYCVVAADGEVLLTRRRTKGGEARLHDKLSIGIGGHINPVDRAEGVDLLLAAARREIEEELEVRGEYGLRLVGFLNDDSNPVGAVHLGLVFVANPTGAVSIREEDVLEGHMVALEDLRARHSRGDNFETWSSILVANLERFLHVEQHATT